MDTFCDNYDGTEYFNLDHKNKKKKLFYKLTLITGGRFLVCVLYLVTFTWNQCCHSVSDIAHSLTQCLLPP